MMWILGFSLYQTETEIVRARKNNSKCPKFQVETCGYRTTRTGVCQTATTKAC